MNGALASSQARKLENSGETKSRRIKAEETSLEDKSISGKTASEFKSHVLSVTVSLLLESLVLVTYNKLS